MKFVLAEEVIIFSEGILFYLCGFLLGLVITHALFENWMLM